MTKRIVKNNDNVTVLPVVRIERGSAVNDRISLLSEIARLIGEKDILREFYEAWADSELATNDKSIAEKALRRLAAAQEAVSALTSTGDD